MALIKNSFSIESGAAIRFQGNINGSISESLFQNLTTEQSGGALSLSCPQKECQYKIENCVFINTTALKYGNVLESHEASIDFVNNSYSIDNQRSAFSKEPSKIIILKPRKIKDFPI